MSFATQGDMDDALRKCDSTVMKNMRGECTIYVDPAGGRGGGFGGDSYRCGSSSLPFRPFQLPIKCWSAAREAGCCRTRAVQRRLLFQLVAHHRPMSSFGCRPAVVLTGRSRCLLCWREPPSGAASVAPPVVQCGRRVSHPSVRAHAAARPTVASFMRLHVWSRTLGVASVQASVTSAIITRETRNCWGGYCDRGTPRASAWRAYTTGAAPESDPLAMGACSCSVVAPLGRGQVMLHRPSNHIEWHWNVSASAVASQPRTLVCL